MVTQITLTFFYNLFFTVTIILETLFIKEKRKQNILLFMLILPSNNKNITFFLL